VKGKVRSDECDKVRMALGYKQKKSFFTPYYSKYLFHFQNIVVFERKCYVSW
jgi:hypothetical protein